MKFDLERYPNDQNPSPILVPRKDIEWEAQAVFNPSVIYDDAVFKMLYRTYPRQTQEAQPKLYRPGFYLTHQISYIGYAESKDGIHFERRPHPFISPSEEYDTYGCEDPRITKVDDTFYITYTAIDSPIEDRAKKPNVRIALATTKDFIESTKHGIIGPPIRSKAAALFSEKVHGGKVALALTVSSDSANSHIAVRYFDSIASLMSRSDDEWNTFLAHSEETTALKTYWWLRRGPELGATPIKTDKGWLLIFSAESMSDSWTISAALVDYNEPHKLIARAPGYILQPVTEYERNGLVHNVTFPGGAVIVGDDLYIYYGCADTGIGLATCKLKDLLGYLEKCQQ